MYNLEDKEQLFLDFYIANSMQASKKVEAYKMAFGEDSEGLTVSTLETYAKRILANQDAKAYIQERKVTSSTQSFQLIEAIRQIDNLIKTTDLKPLETVQLLRERRQTIAELSKLIIIQAPGNSQSDKYTISDMSINVNMGLLEDLEEDEILEAVEHCGSGRFLSIDDQGCLNVITMITKKGDENKVIREAIKKGSFQIAIKKDAD